MLDSLFLNGASLFQILALFYQIRQNKVKKSIYGLSYDFVLYTVLGYTCSIVSTIFYGWNDMTRLIYSNRFPVHPVIKLSNITLLVDCFGLFMSLGLLIQLLLYWKTQNINQGFSFLTVLSLLFVAIVSVFIFFSVNSQESTKIGYMGLFFLDLIDWIWLSAVYFDMVKLIPQVTMNWFGRCTSGFNNQTCRILCLSILLSLCGKLSIKFDFHDIPVNYKTYTCIMSNYVYKDEKPTMKRKIRIMEHSQVFDV